MVRGIAHTSDVGCVLEAWARLPWQVAARIIAATAFATNPAASGGPMDLGDITQLALVATTVLVFGRVGWALARLIDRRSSADPGVQTELAERLRTLEDDHRTVRQELAEIQERQDFTERALLRDGGQARPPAPVVLPDRVVTPR
jgi:hypothetical protein